jgi:hypothetical protein
MLTNTLAKQSRGLVQKRPCTKHPVNVSKLNIHVKEPASPVYVSLLEILWNLLDEPILQTPPRHKIHRF